VSVRGPRSPAAREDGLLMAAATRRYSVMNGPDGGFRAGQVAPPYGSR